MKLEESTSSVAYSIGGTGLIEHSSMILDGEGMFISNLAEIGGGIAV